MAKRFDSDAWEDSLSRINRILAVKNEAAPVAADAADYPPYCNTGGYEESEKINKLQKIVAGSIPAASTN